MKIANSFILSLVVVAGAVGGAGATNIDQIVFNSSSLEAGSNADQSVRGQVAMTCGDIGHPAFLLGQDPHDLADPNLDMMGSCQSTWSNFITAETVDQTVDPDRFDISSLTVWGLSLIKADGFQNCDPSDMTFEVVFYEDNAGQPGTVICPPQSVVPFIVPTGGLINGEFDVYQFDVPAVCDLGSIGRKWFTVESEFYPADCCFIWLSGTGGDGTSLQDAGNGWDLKDNDRSVCINGATVPGDVVLAKSYYIAAAAYAAGAGTSFFQTDVEINNAGTSDASFAFAWLPRNEDNADPVVSDTFSLVVGAGVRYENVLSEIFGFEQGAVGALTVNSNSSNLKIMSRTYNLSDLGTFGQAFPGIPASELITQNEVKRITFMSQSASDTDGFRANLGCINGVNDNVPIDITLFDETGAMLETRRMTLPPYSNKQINEIFSAFAPVNGYADITSLKATAGYYCYGSVLDNVSNDPTTIFPQ